MTDAAREHPENGRAKLSAESFQRLRLAVPRFIAPGPETTPSRDLMRVAMSEICKEAKSRGLKAEQLVVAFKSALDHIPEVHEAPTPAAREEIIRRLVSMCIKEYYR